MAKLNLVTPDASLQPSTKQNQRLHTTNLEAINSHINLDHLDFKKKFYYFHIDKKIISQGMFVAIYK